MVTRKGGMDHLYKEAIFQNHSAIELFGFELSLKFSYNHTNLMLGIGLSYLMIGQCERGGSEQHYHDPSLKILQIVTMLNFFSSSYSLHI